MSDHLGQSGATTLCQMTYGQARAPIMCQTAYGLYAI
jgi:hypothetical protein